MKLIITILIIFLTLPCVAEVKLFRYTDKATGDERGICYSDKDGNPAIVNPDWDMEIIEEKDKKTYIKLYNKQIQAKRNKVKKELKAKRKIIKDKLKAGTPLSQQDVDILVGESN